MKEIDAYKFCPRCGNELATTNLENKKVLKCLKCDSFFFIDPKPTVSAIITKNGKFLLTKRAVEPHKHKWEIPGGFVNLGENLESALKREIKEELGIDISNTKFFTSQEDPYLFQGVELETLISYFICDYEGEICPNSEIIEYDFFDPDNFPEIGSIAHQKIAKMLSKL